MNFETIEQAAKRLGKPVSTIRRWAASGRLQANKVGRQWLIPTETVDEVTCPCWRRLPLSHLLGE